MKFLTTGKAQKLSRAKRHVRLISCGGSGVSPDALIILNTYFGTVDSRSFLFGVRRCMYKTKKYGTVSCKTENQILAELERDLSKKRKKHGSTGHNQGKKPDSQ